MELSIKFTLYVFIYLVLDLILNFAGGYREVEIPSPIPNLEVKHFIADNTAGSPGGNVGRCQLLSFFKSLALNISSCLRLSFFFSLFSILLLFQFIFLSLFFCFFIYCFDLFFYIYLLFGSISYFIVYFLFLANALWYLYQLLLAIFQFTIGLFLALLILYFTIYLLHSLFILYFHPIACIAPMAEQFHGKEEVIGSTPIVSTTTLFLCFYWFFLI